MIVIFFNVCLKFCFHCICEFLMKFKEHICIEKRLVHDKFDKRKSIKFYSKQARLQVCKERHVKWQLGKFCHFEGGVTWRQIRFSRFFFAAFSMLAGTLLIRKISLKKIWDTKEKKCAVWRGTAFLCLELSKRLNIYKFTLLSEKSTNHIKWEFILKFFFKYLKQCRYSFC